MKNLLLYLILCLSSSVSAATITSTAAGGNWSAGGSWVGGIAPTALDDAVIVAGATINITTNPSIINLRVEGTLNFGTNSQTLSVLGNITFAGTGSITGSNSTRNLNVTGNLLSEAGGNGSISGINMTINGITSLAGRVVFNNTTGSKTLIGALTIQNGGTLDFNATVTIVLTAGITMNGTSSLGGTGTATGVLIGVNDFTVSAGANATIGRVNLTVVGLSIFNGIATFNNINGAKSFVGGGQINNNGAIEFTATAALNFANSITMNGTSSIGGASTATGTVTSTSTLTVSALAAATIGRVNMSIAGTSAISGSLTLNNATGTKTLLGDVTVGNNGSVLFSAAATLGCGASLTTNPGSILGNGGTTGTITTGGAFNVLTGGSTFVNGITLSVGTDVVVPGTAVLNCAANTSSISLQGNWNVTSNAANPFVEGTSSVTFNGAAGTQTITTTEAGGEHFYDFGVNNTSTANPGLSTAVNLSVAHNVTYVAGKLDLAGKNFTITGSATASTDTYSTGSIITSVAGSVYTETDASTNKTIFYNGTTFGDATNGILTSVTSANSFFNGSAFYGNASFTKTGSTNNDCDGGSAFFGPVSFTTIVGADRWRMGNVNPDIFYNATFTHNGNGNFIVARASLNNEFFGTTTISSSTAGGFYVGRSNGASGNSSVFHGPVAINITLTGSAFFSESTSTRQGNVTFENTIQVNSTATSTGNVTFGSAGFGSTTLTNTGQFIAGSILGASTITLLRVTQNGNSLPQTITASGISIINCGGADANTFNANVAFTAPQVQLRQTTFNGSTNSFTQTGTVNSPSNGGNVFAVGSSTTFTNQGNGYWRLGAAGADDYNGSVRFVQTGSGALEPSYSNNSTYAADISTVGTATAITFGNNGGRVTVDGSSPQNLNADAARPPVFNQLTMNGSSTFTIKAPLSITSDINFTGGIIFSDAINLLTLNAGCALSGTPSNSSFVDGPIRKVGNTAFTFPTGNSNIYRPIAISAPGNIAHNFTAQYFHSAQAFGGVTTFDPSFYHVSSCEWWKLDRTNGTSNVTVTLSWNSPDCPATYITDPSFLRVARWSGTNWVSEGNGGTTGNAAAGTIVSSSQVTAFNAFTLASTSSANPLPVQLTSFTGKISSNGVSLAWTTASQLNNDFFTLERSQTGSDFTPIATLRGEGTTSQIHHYAHTDEEPFDGTNYYRLKQTDYDGKSTFSHVVAVTYATEEEFVVYPNPARDFVNTNFSGRVVAYNIHYQVVLSASNGSRLDVSQLPAGMYILRNDQGQIQRFIKAD